MPTYDTGEYVNLGPLRQAWERHYIAKGCHPIKAREVARRRVQRKGTWPPENRGT